MRNGNKERSKGETSYRAASCNCIEIKSHKWRARARSFEMHAAQLFNRGEDSGHWTVTFNAIFGDGCGVKLY